MIRILIKAFIYLVIVVPVVRGMASIALGNNWFGWIVGIAVAIGLAVWLETSGKSNELFDKAKAFFSKVTSSPSPGENPSDAKNAESTITCKSCGSQVTLKYGHGTCEACDRVY